MNVSDTIAPWRWGRALVEVDAQAWQGLVEVSRSLEWTEDRLKELDVSDTYDGDEDAADQLNDHRTHCERTILRLTVALVRSAGQIVRSSTDMSQ